MITLGLQIVGSPTAAIDPHPDTRTGRWGIALTPTVTLHVTPQELETWLTRLLAAAATIDAAGTLVDEVTA